MKKKMLQSIIIMLTLSILFTQSCKKDDETNNEPNDKESPSLVITSPTSDFSFLSQTDHVTISGTANDNHSVLRIDWADNHGNKGTANGTNNWIISNIGLSNGDNIITITAYDNAGNSKAIEIVVTYNQFLTFLGNPFILPNCFFVNTPTDVTIKVSILSNPRLDQNSVKLIEVSQNGIVINEICQLFDDGDLQHGDDIKGDGVYGNIVNITRADPGNTYLRVKANTTESQGEVASFSPISTISVVNEVTQEVVQQILTIQHAGDAKFQELITSVSKEQAISQTINYLKGQTDVTSAVTTVSGDISVTYSSGLKGMILTGENGSEGGGGGVSTILEREKKIRIPLTNQTRGTYNQIKSLSSDPNKILDKDVILYGPCYTQFVSWGTEFLDNLNTTLSNSSCSKFNVTYLKNAQADLASLKALSNYGMIVMHTHGGLDENDNVLFQSGEEVSYFSLYIIDWILGRICPGNYLEKQVWLVKPSFITAYNNNFPKSIVYNGSCESAKNTTMSNAFLTKGANTYFGFTESVSGTFDQQMANQLFPEIITNNKTTGEAFIPNQHDNSDPPAYFVMFGNDQTSFSSGLVNGDFEEGNLSGFITGGDGRVITQLGNIGPYGGSFMGIISTGLGFTIDQGSIAQTFCLPSDKTILQLNWNFISEEFLEYVGSIFQDYFQIILIDQNGTEHTLFYKNIDEMYNSYPLTLLSPTIVFDQGDVYGTGWLNLSLNISAYAGQSITLVFKSGDIGDSIYDTAILLDNISVN